MLRIKKIDWYIIKKFLGTFFYSIILLTVIIVVFDVSEKISDFIEKKATLYEIIFDYYLNFIPYFVNTFSSLFTFISVIFFTSKMASKTEIVPILSGGISFYRFLYPYILSGLFITLFSFSLMNYVIPHTNRGLRDFEKKYIHNPFIVRESNLHMQISPNQFVYVENYNNPSKIGYRFSAEQFEDGRLVQRFKSDVIRWDSAINKWVVSNYEIRNFYEDYETIETGNRVDTLMGFYPSDFVLDIEDAKVMTYKELKEFINKEKLKGSQFVQKFEVERYKRITFPLANIILTLIGVSLSSRKVRGGIGIHLGLGIVIAFTYIFLQQVTGVAALYSKAPLWLIMWLPNIIYAVLAVFLLKMAPK